MCYFGWEGGINVKDDQLDDVDLSKSKFYVPLTWLFKLIVKIIKKINDSSGLNGNNRS